MRRASTARGHAVPVLAVLLAATLALVAAACGGDGSGASTAAGGDRLVIVRDDGEGGRVRSAVDCAAAPAVCDAVRAARDAPADRACTQVYGGPQRIEVSGVLDGRPVDLEITRRDGCEIDRYDRVAAALEAG